MSIEHKNSSDGTTDSPYDGGRHEPKGISRAGSNEMYLADGAGSGTWQHSSPHGGWRYNDIGVGTTFSSPTTYTLMNTVGTSTHLHDFTHNSLGRLTYIGTPERHIHMVCDLSFKHSTGSGQDVFFAIYKNGAIVTPPDAEMVQSADSANYDHIALHFDDVISTNEYIEIYLKSASGNVIVHSAYMFILGMPS